MKQIVSHWQKLAFSIIIVFGMYAQPVLGATGPPTVAIDACEGKTLAETCSFTGPNAESLSGTCEQLGDVIACVPDDGSETPVESSASEEESVAPVLTLTTSGSTVVATWTAVNGASGYYLYYAPYPSQSPIEFVDMGVSTTISTTLPDGAAFYVAIQAYGDSVSSAISNIEYFIIDSSSSSSKVFSVVDTAQTKCFNSSSEITCPSSGSSFFGQDAQYAGTTPSYTDNNDETVTDNQTGLIWQNNPGAKKTYDEAVAEVGSFELAGYDDWRIPTIKELYSLMNFIGQDPSGYSGTSTSGLIPFIDTDSFDFEYGDTTTGERIIDSQYGSSNVYVDYTGPNNDDTLFGVNFADGRIKGYGMVLGGTAKTFFFIYVRGSSYGENDFKSNGDGTVTDSATGLVWQQDDNGNGVDWEDGLSYCDDLSLASNSDWRLPNIKELQVLVDYTK